MLRPFGATAAENLCGAYKHHRNRRRAFIPGFGISFRGDFKRVAFGFTVNAHHHFKAFFSLIKRIMIAKRMPVFRH